MKDPRVSICIPAYRQVEYLRRALDSVRAQDFADYEVVITDDSPDRTVSELVKTYLGDPRWRYYHNESQLGSPENWNEAVRRSSSPLIKILHHDDFFSGPASLRGFVALMEANPDANLGFSATTVHDVTTGSTRSNCPSPRQVESVSVDPTVLFAGNIIGAPSATIYRRAAGLEFDRRLKWLVDIDFYINVLKRSPRLAFSPVALIATPTNATHQVTELVRNDMSVDIGEHLLVFEKFEPAERHRPILADAWRRLFFRYGITSQSELEALFPQSAELKGYFVAVFDALSTPSSRVMRRAYETYMRLPATLRGFIRDLRDAARRYRP